ncbi:hypothetical protein AB833_03460 [Chromatiales bacterium (ex Bugula neritina AB1)]|nr:hypothetical protein AB833_03460 [Chromatiales bacterium (ex Bugula neritina AB1)]
MAGYSAVPALLPHLIDEWSLSNTEGGWLAGVFFAGYVLSVLLIVALSDRIASRTIYLVSAAICVLATVLFAQVESYSGALVLRAMAGVALAGTNMPGLKALTDYLSGNRRARVVAWYTVSFSVGAGLSFVLAGNVAAIGGWRFAFFVAAAVTAAGFIIALLFLPKPPATAAPSQKENPWDFLPVLRNRAVMGFVIAYAAVIWANAGIRQWLVVFLEATSLNSIGSELIYLVAALASLIGVPAGLLGNELAIRYGSRYVAVRLFGVAAVASFFVGWLYTLPGALVIVTIVLYAFVIQGNISNLTAGTVASAEPGRAGATLALHSFIGFTGGILGPLSFGVMLDMAGGTDSQIAWLFAYGSCGLVCLVGALALYQRRS